MQGGGFAQSAPVARCLWWRCVRQVHRQHGRPGGHRRKRFDHICGIADQRGPVTDQHVTARGACIQRAAGHGQHLAALVQRIARGDQAAGFCRSFDHDCRTAQTRDDAVARGEMSRHRLQAHGLF